jgi:transcriptional regulator with XRE-family HTH domain
MATATNNIVGPQVRRLRVARGISQSNLAGACQRGGWDISRAVLAKIECGLREVRDKEMIELAKALHCPVSELFPARVHAAVKGKK